MEELKHLNNLEKLLNSNIRKIQNLENTMKSLDRVEASIGKKIEIHRKHIEILHCNFRQSLDTYHNICNNLKPTIKYDDMREKSRCVQNM